MENILDEIYFNEPVNVGYNNDPAKKYVKIADEIKRQRCYNHYKINYDN